jgi:hypothetical protein
MCETHDLSPDIEAIAMSGWTYVDTITIFFPSVQKNFTMDLPLAFILTIVGLLNYVVVQCILDYGFLNSIM